jgi:hypothetical protein
MAPKLLKKQVNTDYTKETLFNKETTYGSKTMAGLARLIQKKSIDITNLDTMSPSNIKSVSKQLKLKSISEKSTVRLLEEIKAVAKMYVAGQGSYYFCLFMYWVVEKIGDVHILLEPSPRHMRQAKFHWCR